MLNVVRMCCKKAHQARCVVLLSVLDPGVPGYSQSNRRHTKRVKSHQVSSIGAWPLKEMRISIAASYSSRYLRAEYFKSREKAVFCPASCSGLCPTNLEDKTLMSRSAYTDRKNTNLPFFAWWWFQYWASFSSILNESHICRAQGHRFWAKCRNAVNLRWIFSAELRSRFQVLPVHASPHWHLRASKHRSHAVFVSG